MRRPTARRLAPILLVLVAVGGLLGTSEVRQALGAVADPGTAGLRATTAGIEAVLPARLATALERAPHPSSSKQRLPLLLAVVPALLLAWAVGRLVKPEADAHRPRLWALTPPGRGPPHLQLAPT